MCELSMIIGVSFLLGFVIALALTVFNKQVVHVSKDSYTVYRDVTYKLEPANG